MPEIGHTISQYKILQKIGEGGMGVVFLAEESSLWRKVAIAFLSSDLQQDKAARYRILREARSAAGLSSITIQNTPLFDDLHGNLEFHNLLRSN